jgi:hypothetical protein
VASFQIPGKVIHKPVTNKTIYSLTLEASIIPARQAAAKLIHRIPPNWGYSRLSKGSSLLKPILRDVSTCNLFVAIRDLKREALWVEVAGLESVVTRVAHSPLSPGR